MKAITTRYLGPTNCRGARIIASDGYFKVTVSYDYGKNTEQAHYEAVKALVEKHWRTGPVTFVVGHQKNALVWVIATRGYGEFKHPGTE